MSLQHLRKTPWLRAALSALVLCFALGTLAYAGHTHESGKLSHAHYSCDYCTSFGGLIDPPATIDASIAPIMARELIATPDRLRGNTHLIGLAQARAPPSC